jgi:hypothetical protein
VSHTFTVAHRKLGFVLAAAGPAAAARAVSAAARTVEIAFVIRG